MVKISDINWGFNVASSKAKYYQFLFLLLSQSPHP